jgi:hypothetical protein
MKTLKFCALLLLITSLCFNCKKTGKNPEDPCNSILNENPPLKVAIVLADKQSGNNLILSTGLTAADIKLSLSGSTMPVTNWRLINTPASPLYGILELAVFHEKAGEYRYKIEAKGLKEVEFSYTIRQVKSESPCKIYAYPMEGLKAINQDFVPLTFGDKNYSNGIKVLIN